jgi:O-antigen ligase
MSIQRASGSGWSGCGTSCDDRRYDARDGTGAHTIPCGHEQSRGVMNETPSVLPVTAPGSMAKKARPGLARTSPPARQLPFAKLVLPLLISRAALDAFLGNFDISVGGVSLSPGALLNLLIVACAALIFLKQTDLAAPRLAVLCWSPFLLWNAMEAARSPDLPGAIKVLFAYVSFASVFYLALEYNLLSRSRSALASIFTLSAIIPLTVALVQIVTSGGDSERIAGSMPHPNIFAFYLTILISVLYERILAADTARLERALYGAFAGLALIVLLLTGTRSAWIGLYLFLILYTLLTKPALTLALFVLPLAALGLPEVRDRLFDIVDASSYTPDISHIQMMARGQVAGSNLSGFNSLAWRKLIWAATLEEVWKNPVIGHGLEAFTHDATSFFAIAGGEKSATHNIYIQILYESGIVGLISFLWITIGSTIHAIRNNYPVKYYAIAIPFSLSFLIESYSDNMLYYLADNWYFWFCCGSFISAFSSKMYKTGRKTPSTRNRIEWMRARLGNGGNDDSKSNAFTA